MEKHYINMTEKYSGNHHLISFFRSNVIYRNFLSSGTYVSYQKMVVSTLFMNRDTIKPVTPLFLIVGIFTVRASGYKYDNISVVRHLPRRIKKMD